MSGMRYTPQSLFSMLFPDLFIGVIYNHALLASHTANVYCIDEQGLQRWNHRQQHISRWNWWSRANQLCCRRSTIFNFNVVLILPDSRYTTNCNALFIEYCAYIQCWPQFLKLETGFYSKQDVLFPAISDPSDLLDCNINYHFEPAKRSYASMVVDNIPSLHILNITVYVQSTSLTGTPTKIFLEIFFAGSTATQTRKQFEQPRAVAGWTAWHCRDSSELRFLYFLGAHQCAAFPTHAEKQLSA